MSREQDHPNEVQMIKITAFAKIERLFTTEAPQVQEEFELQAEVDEYLQRMYNLFPKDVDMARKAAKLGW
jgi:hypothetical protein